MPHALPRSCLTSTATGPTETLAHLDEKGIAHEREGGPHLSPIDRAFEGLVVVTQLAAEKENDWKPQLGLMLSASAVAVAEDYFRTLLAESALICPLCTPQIDSLQTRMEFVRSGSIDDALRASFGLDSLSGQSGVRGWAKTLAGFEIRSGSTLSDALREFELVCHVRHCAVHSGGYVGAHNATVLSVPAGTWISFRSPDAIHAIVAVVTRTIRGFNQSLFEHLLGRWIDGAVLSGDWAEDRRQFEPLWHCFRSTADTETGRLAGEPGFYTTAFNAYRSIRQAVVNRQVATA